MMAPRKKNDSGNGETTSQAIPQNEIREQYVKLLQDYHSDSTLTYDKLAQNVSQKPELGLQYDQEVVKQAQKSKEMSLEQVANTVSQGPYVQNQLNSDKQQVQEYLAQIQKSYAALPDIQQEQASKQSNNGKQPEQQQTTTIPDAKLGAGFEMTTAQKSSREAQDYALGIVQMLDQRRINVDRLQIDVNGQTIFKMRDGDIDARKTSINSEHTELIKKALNDPASLEGTVKITQGNQILLHIRDGRVLIDSAGLTKQSAKVEVNTPDFASKGLYESFSKDVNSNGLQATKDIAANALKAGVKHEQVLDLLKAYDHSYQKLANSQGEKVAQRTLEKMVDSVQASQMQQKMPQQQESQQVKATRSVKV